MNFRFGQFSWGYLLTIVSLCMAPTLLAAPSLISYQGRLSDPAGSPVADGSYQLRFRIYDSPSGGITLWDSQARSVQLSAGVYTYILGQDVPFPANLFGSSDRWLGVTVGADPEMSPRRQFLSNAFALQARDADIVPWSGISGMPAGFADGIDDNSGGDITAVNTSGGLTGGATSGDANISIAPGGVTSAHIGDGQIVDADISPTANISPGKILGGAASLTENQTFSGVNKFTSNITFFDSTAGAIENTFMIGRQSAPPSAMLAARRNYNSTFNLYGLYAWMQNVSTGPLYGVYGLCRASTAGSANAGNVYGVYGRGESDASERSGLLAYAKSLTPNLQSGGSYGLIAHAYYGTAVFGVFAQADSSAFFCYGVRGLSRAAAGIGYGIYGAANDGSGYGYGIYGEAFNNGFQSWAGYFNGDVNVTGIVATPAFLTRMDHPLDPENMYLYQAGVQSSEQTNLYSGNVDLDENGEATVVLPDWIEAANSEFRYQLTCIGGYAQVFVAQEVTNNRFKIAGGTPGLRVSWQLTGIRNDLYAKAHPFVAEQLKPGFERGKYLNPELYGLGRELAIGYAPKNTADLPVPRHNDE